MMRKVVLLALPLAAMAGLLVLPAYFATPARTSGQEAEDNPFGAPAADRPVSPFGPAPGEPRPASDKEAEPAPGPPVSPFGPAPGEVAPPTEPEASPKPRPEPKPKPPGKPLVEGPMRSGEKAITEALEQSYPLVLQDATLQELAEMLRDNLKISVALDRRELEDVSLAPDKTLVSFDCRGLPLGTALTRMLEVHDLAWTIHGEALLITTDERELNLLETKVYDVSDLVKCLDEYGRVWADFDSLIYVITETLEPVAWDKFGGAGSIEGISLRNGDALVVRQTFHMHRKIAGLLAELRKVNTPQPGTTEGAVLPPRRLPAGHFVGAGGGMGSW